MKPYLPLLLLLIIAQYGMATGLKLGDKLETTLAKLGKPIGTLELRQKTLLLYPEGEVVLKEDRVVEIDLMTAAEFETERSRESTRYGLRYYYDPVVQPRYIYRPPTVTIFSNGQKHEVKTKKPDYWKLRQYNPDGTAERVARILHGNESD